MKDSTGFHFRTERYRRHFSPILNKWAKSIIRYTKEYDPNDALYWYNERATLSTLAGAIWRSNFYAFEEFSSKKSSRLREKWVGRTDLWAAMRKTEYAIEAKQAWVALSSRAKKNVDRVWKSLRAACRDAVNSRSPQQKALGVTFAVPRVPKLEHSQVAELTSGFLTKIRGLDYDFMSYAFPRWDNLIDLSGRLYPGVILLARAPRRS